MRIVILTGAGISAESGIQTFRGADGLWEGHRVEDVASPEGFQRDPSLVYRFYNERRRKLVHGNIQPNAAHQALVKLENELGDNFLLITQNIDDLHKRAGSRRLLPMHGELRKARCRMCLLTSDWDDDFDGAHACPLCRKQGGLRPHIVWFGEMPFFMDEIYEALTRCDIFVAIGTSGHVYPAAGFVNLAQGAGAETVELNLEPSAVHSNFDKSVWGAATQVVPEWVESILSL